jgi:hypothetical protein
MKKNPGKLLLLLATVFFSIFIVLFVAASTIQAANNQSVPPTTDISKMYKQAVASPLVKAGGDIKNQEISQFYQKLVQSYELSNTDSSSDESLSLASMLPDIKGIYKTASDLPFKEAGKQIKDKEIAEFYYNFISAIGVEK